LVAHPAPPAHHQEDVMTTDFGVRCEGTIWVLTPLNDAAREWIKDNLPSDATTWGSSIIVEHRYMDAIREGIREDGFTMEMDIVNSNL
jgi:predicted thioesterase